MPTPAARSEFSLAPRSNVDSAFTRIRDTTLALCSSLEIEDCVVQSMPDASPLKWHLAHTTWFFERFVLAPHSDSYRPFDGQYEFLFNSYYQSVGAIHERAQRGIISRPTVAEIIRYRRFIDGHVQALLQSRPDDLAIRALITLGLQHEQQHQELMLTDIKHAFFCNPLFPAYRQRPPQLVDASELTEQRLVFFEGGIKAIGALDSEFGFDCEQPRHRVFLEPFALANRLVTNGEYLEFIRDGGYETPTLWLADGWDQSLKEHWKKPLYWSDSLESEFTLQGMAALDRNAPVCHVSYYEADAFARWAGRRLPTEFEWESVATTTPLEGNLLSADVLQPVSSSSTRDRIPVMQMFGDVWEWTASSYGPYPGFSPLAGALGEYNGKFMSGRFVLRGGSCVTPDDHIRASYRNYFPPHTRWQFSGVRLAQ